MYKNSILILILLFSFQATSAQKIFYSEKLNDRVDYTRSHIIGKVRNNIVILKYGGSYKKAELLIYDYNMHFKKTVPFDIVNSDVLARLDFVIRGNVFDAIIQYYTTKNFYCKIARFNDEGQLVNVIQTIDSVHTKKQNEEEIYHIIKSENNEQVILMRAFTGIKPNCLQLEYKFINNKFKIDQEKKYVIPFSEDTQLSPFYLNNSGELLFCEFVPGSDEQNAILFYKIPKYSDTAVNSVQFINSNIPTEITITVDNNKKEYLINGLFYKTPDEDLPKPFAQSIYSCLFSDELIMKGKDTTVEIQLLDSLEAITLNNMLLVNSGNASNNGYYVTCAGTNSSYLNAANSDMEFQRYERPNYEAVADAGQLLAHPYMPESARNNTSTLGQPSNPIWSNGNEVHPNSIIQSETGLRASYARPKDNKAGQDVLLLTMHITNENKLEWIRIFNDSLRNNYYAVTNISQGITTQNLHFVFSDQVARNKKTISELVISKTGEYYFRGIALNDLHYDIQLDKGVQIDDKSMVFPCNVKERLGFVRIEFD